VRGSPTHDRKRLLPSQERDEQPDQQNVVRRYDAVDTWAKQIAEDLTDTETLG
jgi:hypothetical protein